VHASVGEVEILKVGKITELRRHHTVERIPAEIEMLQVSQREQRSCYLAFKKCSTRALGYWVIMLELIFFGPLVNWAFDPRPDRGRPTHYG